MSAERLRVLCVDDEARVLEGLSLHLRRRYEVIMATSGAAGLEVLQQDGQIALVISDMKMPGMDGATFLAQVRRTVPLAIRILLTGQTNLDSAIAAVNEGQIFRFLIKPCPPNALLAAIDAGAEQYRLVTAERVLLEQTLHGSIKAMMDVLALTNPISFGRATRIKKQVTELGSKVNLENLWQVEIAAMLCQLGYIALPAEVVEKVYHGHLLTESEAKMVAKVPSVTEQLLANIPRLESVREILSIYQHAYKQGSASTNQRRNALRQAAQVLRVIIDLDTLESGGMPTHEALAAMRGRHEAYDPAVLEALAEARCGEELPNEIQEIPFSKIRLGMTFATDVQTTSGLLLVPKGYQVTLSFLERAQNYVPGTVKDPVYVTA